MLRAIILTNPPPNIADTILNRYGDWKFPSLSGALMTPTLRPDGSILSELGYDENTGLYLLDSPIMPKIAEKPSKEKLFSINGTRLEVPNPSGVGECSTVSSGFAGNCV